MVQIGTISYKAEVTGADEAEAKTESLTDSYAGMGEQATETAEDAGFLAGTLSTVADQAEAAGEAANDADNIFTLLEGTLTTVSGASEVVGSAGLSGIGAIAEGVAGVFGGGAFAAIQRGFTRLFGWLSGLTLSGILGSVTTALGNFVGWLAAGSAGAFAVAGAIGAVIGLFGVWILEITGVLDSIEQLGQQLSVSLPGWARDGINAVIGLFAGPLAVIGGFIVGFIEGGFDQAFARANQIIDIFAGSFRRTFNRIAGFFRGLWSGLSGFLSRTWAGITATVNQVWQGIQATITGVWNAVEQAAREFVDGTVGFITGIPGRIAGTISDIQSEFNTLVSEIIGFFEGIGDTAAGSVQTAFNSTVPSSVELPTITIGGGTHFGQDVPEKRIEMGTVDLPQLQTGGTVVDTGVAEVHEGEVVGEPRALVEAAGMGGGDGDMSVGVDTIRIDLSGDFDPTDLSRRQLDSLADDLVDRIGAKANQQTGIR